MCSLALYVPVNKKKSEEEGGEWIRRGTWGMQDNYCPKENKDLQVTRAGPESQHQPTGHPSSHCRATRGRARKTKQERKHNQVHRMRGIEDGQCHRRYTPPHFLLFIRSLIFDHWMSRRLTELPLKKRRGVEGT